MNEKVKEIAIDVMKLVGIFVNSVLCTVFRGYVISVTWGWFIVPVFNLPALSLVYALGLNCVAQLISVPKMPIANEDEPYKQMFYSWTFPLVGLVIGWILKSLA